MLNSAGEGRGQRAESRARRGANAPSRIPELQTCRAVLGMSSVCHCPSLIVNWTRLGDNVPAKRSDTGLRWHHEEIWRRISFPTVCHRTLCVVRPRHTLIPPGTFSTARDRGQGTGTGGSRQRGDSSRTTKDLGTKATGGRRNCSPV